MLHIWRKRFDTVYLPGIAPHTYEPIRVLWIRPEADPTADPNDDPLSRVRARVRAIVGR